MFAAEHQIRSGFLAGAEVVERAHAAHIAALREGGPPLRNPWGRGMIVHFFPMNALGAGTSIDLQRARWGGYLLSFFPTASNVRYTVDGLLAEGDGTYSILYRSGVLETASTEIASEPVPSVVVVHSLIDSLNRYLKYANCLTPQRRSTFGVTVRGTQCDDRHWKEHARRLP